jgi:hypothetical protein
MDKPDFFYELKSFFKRLFCKHEAGLLFEAEYTDGSPALYVTCKDCHKYLCDVEDVRN